MSKKQAKLLKRERRRLRRKAKRKAMLAERMLMLRDPPKTATIRMTAQAQAPLVVFQSSIDVQELGVIIEKSINAHHSWSRGQ